MSSSKVKKVMSFFKKNKGKIEAFADEEEVKELVAEARAGLKPEAIAQNIDKAAAKLDALAQQEEQDGSVSTGVMSWISKGKPDTATVAPARKKTLKKQVISTAIKNWRYALPVLMSAWWWLLAWSWLLIFIVPVYLFIKKRSKKTA